MAIRISASDFWSVARTPRWIAALVLALGIAAAFAALGQWQLQRSFENAATVEIDTETPVWLADITGPGSGLTEEQLGRVVIADGSIVAGDTVELTDRPDGFGGRGSWFVGHVVTDEGVSLAVVLGFSPDGVAPDLPAGGREWVGRYLPSEEPQSSDFENGERSAISVAELVNLWTEPGPVYGGFVVLLEPIPGLEPIRADAAERETVLSWLNVFYAIEWVIFAGFAIYLWYRLVRDVVERRAEEARAANVD